MPILLKAIITIVKLENENSIESMTCAYEKANYCSKNADKSSLQNIGNHLFHEEWSSMSESKRRGP